MNNVTREIELAEEIIKAEPTPAPKKEYGMVIGCAKLNVRKRPSKKADVLCTIDKDEKVEITGKTHHEFYKVCLASGIEGFCMKSFIKTR